ncbi:hypothetical protein BD779DRAFT_1582964, partial [Infundibulicybe gibba]
LHCQLPIKLSKSTILNPEPRNAAAKLALAETHYPSISRSTGRLVIVLRHGNAQYTIPPFLNLAQLLFRTEGFGISQRVPPI